MTHGLCPLPPATSTRPPDPLDLLRGAARAIARALEVRYVTHRETETAESEVQTVTTVRHTHARAQRERERELC
jgi:hypothetical protein